MRRILLLLSLAAGLYLCAGSTAYAIPAFARREGVLCQMCHFRPPELNADGRAYLERGLREEPLPAGASGPAAATKAPLGQPIALRLTDYVSVMGTQSITNETGQGTDFNAGGLDLWVAGPFDPHLSAVLDYAIDIEGDSADTGLAYGQYITQWKDKFGSARFGRLVPLAILLNQGGPSMSVSVPVALSTAPDTGSGWTPSNYASTLELGAVNLPRGSVYVGLAQPHLEASGGDESASLLRRLGAQPELTAADAGGDPRHHTDVYVTGEYLLNDRGTSLTGYGYWGKTTLAGGANSNFHRLGVFGNYYTKKGDTKLMLGYLTGRDEDANGKNLDNSGGFLMGEHLINDRWAAYGRWDQYRQDLSAGGDQTVRGPAVGVSYWVGTPVWLTAELQSLHTTGQGTDRLATLQLLWIF